MHTGCPIIAFNSFQVHNKLNNTHMALMHFSWAMDLDPKGANSQIKDALDPTLNRIKQEEEDQQRQHQQQEQLRQEQEASSSSPMEDDEEEDEDIEEGEEEDNEMRIATADDSL